MTIYFHGSSEKNDTPKKHYLFTRFDEEVVETDVVVDPNASEEKVETAGNEDMYG